MGAPKRYWVWIDGKPGLAPHEVPAAMLESGILGITHGHSFGIWSTALAYLRECMKAGFICRVYQEE